jgi:hypothetical protein
VRTNLTIEDLGDLLDKALVAVLATLRVDGSVLLSPVYHEWRDGGFNIWVERQNIKARHLRRDPERPSWWPNLTRRCARSKSAGGRALSSRACPRPRCGS